MYISIIKLVEAITLVVDEEKQRALTLVLEVTNLNLFKISLFYGTLKPVTEPCDLFHDLTKSTSCPASFLALFHYLAKLTQVIDELASYDQI